MATTPDAHPTTKIRDPAVMRALAHPARLTLLQHLSTEGPTTATESAEIVGLSPSATSYHLRALAKVGLVEEAPGRGDGRERRWRSKVGPYELEGGPDTDPEVRDAKRELVDSFVTWEETRVREFLARIDDEPREWQDVSFIMEAVLSMTADELAGLRRSMDELLEPYRKRRRKEPPPGARTVTALFRAFPTDTPL